MFKVDVSYCKWQTLSKTKICKNLQYSTLVTLLEAGHTWKLDQYSSGIINLNLGIVTGITLGFLLVATFISVYIYAKCRSKDKEANPKDLRQLGLIIVFSIS